VNKLLLCRWRQTIHRSSARRFLQRKLFFNFFFSFCFFSSVTFTIFYHRSSFTGVFLAWKLCKLPSGSGQIPVFLTQARFSACIVKCYNYWPAVVCAVWMFFCLLFDDTFKIVYHLITSLMADSHFRPNSTVVNVGDSAMTSLELWRHAAVHRPRIVCQFGWAVELSWVASAS